MPRELRSWVVSTKKGLPWRIAKWTISHWDQEWHHFGCHSKKKNLVEIRVYNVLGERQPNPDKKYTIFFVILKTASWPLGPISKTVNGFFKKETFSNFLSFQTSAIFFGISRASWLLHWNESTRGDMSDWFERERDRV
jgi:hypothetical protein